MAAKTTEDSGGIIAEINVTPFVDIVLVLLIIFMVAVPMIMNQAIKVNLPKAASGKSADTTTIAITIKKDGRVYLNGKETDRVPLAKFLAAEARANKQIRAIVSADQEVAHGTVVSYLDLLNVSGISRYAISVEKPADDPMTP